MTPAPLPATQPSHAWLKAGLFALLAGNTAAYVISGTVTEAVDAIAWLVVLVLFELETDAAWRANAVRGARLVAGAAIVVAAARYVREEEWLDAVNAGFWIGMVVLLESQVRFPAFAARRRADCAVAAGVIYAGLGALAVAWMWQREWFDAYDALLWLAALIVIEKNILRRLAGAGPRSGPSPRTAV